jgi:hypothetical protein
MKTNSKLISILAVLLIIGLLVPGVSFAKSIREWFNIRGRNNVQEEQKASESDNEEEQRASESHNELRNKQLQFCNLIGIWTDKVDQNIIGRQFKIQGRQTERSGKLNERRDNRDVKLEQYRQNWEEKWEKHFEKLEEKATTSVQMEALVEFKEAVKDAIASRQAAIDAAISEYRTDLDKMIADRKTATENAKIEYQNAYKTAIDKAKTDCAAGIDPAQVRETLRAALKAVKDKFEKDRQAIEKMDVKPLVDARQQAFKEALEYFKKAMQEARDKLKTALGL